MCNVRQGNVRSLSKVAAGCAIAHCFAAKGSQRKFSVQFRQYFDQFVEVLFSRLQDEATTLRSDIFRCACTDMAGERSAIS